MKILLFTSPLVNSYLHIGRCGGSSKGGEKWPPVKLMFAASALRDVATVRILDAEGRMDEKAFLREAGSWCPDLVVFDPVAPTAARDAAVVGMIKDALPDARAVAMGAHSTALGETFLGRFTTVDYAIAGEAEATLREFVAGGAQEAVAGMWYRRDGRQAFSGERPLIDPLDDLPLPAHDMLDRGIYSSPFVKRPPFTITEVSRGCPFPCLFCNSHLMGGRVPRRRSIERVGEELRWIRRLGFNELMFNCSTFTLDREYAEALAGLFLRERLGLGWSAHTRVDLIDEELLRLMAAAGCHTLFLGVESASAEIRDYFRKPFSLEGVPRLLARARFLGIRSVLHIVFGAPMETKETIRETIDFLTASGADFVGINILTPYAGTPLHDDLMGRGLVLSDDGEDMDQSSTPAIRTERLSAGEIEDAVRAAYRTFYLRPGYLARRLRDVRNLSTFKSYSRALLNILRKVCLK